MFFLLFAFWIILNGRWTTEVAIVGAGRIGVMLAEELKKNPRSGRERGWDKHYSAQ